MNASNNYRTGALMENLEGRSFFSVTQVLPNPASTPAVMNYSSEATDVSGSISNDRRTTTDTGPAHEGPKNDGIVSEL